MFKGAKSVTFHYLELVWTRHSREKTPGWKNKRPPCKQQQGSSISRIEHVNKRLRVLKRVLHQKRYFRESPIILYPFFHSPPIYHLLNCHVLFHFSFLFFTLLSSFCLSQIKLSFSTISFLHFVSLNLIPMDSFSFHVCLHIVP